MRPARGQNLVLLALTMLSVVVMAMMTLSITNRVRNKLDLQTRSDVASYDNAVATARAFNTIGVINRTIVSHWVVMLGLQANVAFGSSVPAYFDAVADVLENWRWNDQCGNGSNPTEDRRQLELREARNAFMHASFSLWNGAGNIDVTGCPQCFPKLDPGFGPRDREVTNEAKSVHAAIRDLVEVQRGIQLELQKKLEEQLGAKASAGGFPYQVEQGAPRLAATGIQDRPPGWREVSSALGTTREALGPLAHAAMGSRANRFLLSGRRYHPNGGNDYETIDPYRAQLYRAWIEKTLNNRFGVPGRQKPFKFNFAPAMMTTWMQRGKSSEEDDDWDIDDFWEWIDTYENIVAPPEVPDEVAVPEPPAREPEQYNPRYGSRITPAREIGFEYVTAKQPATLRIKYEGPCGRHRTKTNIYSWARIHSDGTLYVESAHEWTRGRILSRHTAPDMTQTVLFHEGDPLHGRKSGGKGLEASGHVPSGLCHWWHKHRGEVNDDDHWVGREIDSLGVAPGGFGFVFPQAGDDPDTKLPRDAATGAFGQPKLPVLMTRANSGGGMTRDPWDLRFTLRFESAGSGTRLDIYKETAAQPMAIVSTGMAYYHRRCDSHQRSSMQPYAVPGVPEPDRGRPRACGSWMEPPNLLNPFWHATLVPIDIDEKLPADGDETPGARKINEARRMLAASNLDDAAEVYRLLHQAGYEGIE